MKQMRCCLNCGYYLPDGMSECLACGYNEKNEYPYNDDELPTTTLDDKRFIFKGYGLNQIAPFVRTNQAERSYPVIKVTVFEDYSWRAPDGRIMATASKYME